MKQFGRVLSRIIAFPLAFLLVLLIPLVFSLFNIRQLLFNPAQVSGISQSILRETNILRESVLWFSSGERKDQFVQTFQLTEQNRQYMDSFFSALTDDDWQNLEDIMIQDGYVSAWSQQTIESTVAWLNSGETYPDIVFDMTGYKAYLSEQAVEEVITIVSGALPSCTGGERQSDEMCVLEGENGEAQIIIMQETFQQGISNIPAQYDVSAIMLENELRLVDGVSIEQAKLFIRGIRLVPWVLLGLPIYLAVFIFIITGRQAGESSLWAGIPLILGGFVTFLLGTLNKILMPSIISLIPLSETLPAFLRQELKQTLSILINPVLEPMAIQGLIIIVPGVILLVVGSIVTVVTQRHEHEEIVEEFVEVSPATPAKDTVEEPPEVDSEAEEKVDDNTIVL